MSDVAAIVLCGGTSRRMGVADKTALPFAGSTVLNHLLDSLPEDWPVVCVGPRRPTRRTVAWTRESPPGAGPVAGLAAGLALVTAPVCVLLAGDLPFAGPAARELANWFLRSGHPKSDAGPSVVDGVAAIDGARRTQPLLAAYRTAVLRAALPTDPAGARVMSIVQRLRLETRQCSDLACLDVDTPEALARARVAAEHKADPQCDPAPPGPARR